MVARATARLATASAEHAGGGSTRSPITATNDDGVAQTSRTCSVDVRGPTPRVSGVRFWRRPRPLAIHAHPGQRCRDWDQRTGRGDRRRRRRQLSGPGPSSVATTCKKKTSTWTWIPPPRKALRLGLGYAVASVTWSAWSAVPSSTSGRRRSTCHWGGGLLGGGMATPAVAEFPWTRVTTGALRGHVGQHRAGAHGDRVFALGWFGEVDLSVGGRLDNPTNEVAPGDAAIALQEQNVLRRILLDDGLDIQNPDPSPTRRVGCRRRTRCGSATRCPASPASWAKASTATGCSRWGSIAVRPHQPPPGDSARTWAARSRPRRSTCSTTSTATVLAAASRPPAVPRRRSSSTASATRSSPPSVELDADVVGLMELENDDTDAQYGADRGPGRRAEPGQRCGHLRLHRHRRRRHRRDPGRHPLPAGGVTPVGDFAILDSSVDPRFIDTLNRPSIAQTFEANADGAAITAVVNHLKSQGLRLQRGRRPRHR